MAANQYGIDLGSMYRTAEAVKGARTQNKLSAMKLAEAERLEAERPERERLAKERQNKLSVLRQQAATGDQGAMRQLIAFDPEGAPQMLDAISKLDEKELKLAKSRNEEIVKLAGFVRAGKTDQDKQARYAYVYGQLPDELKGQMPESYDPSFIEMTMAKGMALDKIFENPKVITVGKEDIAYQAGSEIGRGKRPQKQTGTGEAGGIKSADESFLYRLSGGLFDAVFDQQGNITNLDPMTRSKVQAITDRASELLSEGGITRARAVTQAAEEFGVKIPKGTKVDESDPLGIR